MDDIDFKTKYLMYKAKYLNLKNKVIKVDQKGGSDGVIDVILFKGEHCGYCKKFLPTWNALQKSLVSNKRYNFITYDNELNKEMFEKYDINGVPTIYLKQGDTTRLYDGERDLDSLLYFELILIF